MSDKNTKLEITKNVPFTVINRFLPKPEDQQELVEVLTAGISDEMAIQPGFIAASIQRSLDSNDVLVYAQWESADALAAAGGLVAAGKAPNMARGFELGQPQYHPYEVSAVILAPDA
ncbi:MAG: antibiotic biosynthesis monooxygenase [Chloroflexi bacterium AL-W]|nr:antibiotic biosynthesis monooxygenase [Chloroflexi bacterium AL-N1]NOK70826.1 antibiotic biosynthesis monooxygenase [Chloroflexi bacterium AL-N10]NOK78386.1 antibiotic biosynthesis monooxygenase [Chloroflexi bacterium AL-N5]NOK85367.1 antibiotic biosynthesis monooxygenase [Chloroflexi bacterium AL-W]NOK92643.1 antibiotic biosynthesis monooxygenase [Chloroflexi bacterium AL-N15]